MCLIAVLKAGTDKYSDLIIEGIKKASVSNTDGIGYAFKRAKDNSKIYISKGYNDVDAFIKLYKSKKLTDIDEVIIHLRIGNKGAVNEDMNHPFVLSNEEELILTNGGLTELPVVAHNGTFTEFAIYNSKFSDTYFFIKDFMSIPEFQELLKRDIATFKKIFKSILGTNKLAFIFPGNQELITIGEYIEDEGYLFSNKSYKEIKYRNVGGFEEWDDYADYMSVHRQNNWGNRERAESSSVPELKGLDISKDIDPRPFNLTDSVTDKHTYRNIYPVMEGSLYVPFTYVTAQYQESKFVPMKFNYKHFRFYSRDINHALGLKRFENYNMVEYDQDLKRQCHILKRMLEDDTESWQNAAYVNTKEILAYCSIHPDANHMVNYIEVFKLIQLYTPSKKLYNHIKGTIVTLEGQKRKWINFKNVPNVHIDSLKIWWNYMTYALYPENYNTPGILYQVQEVDAEDTEAEPRVYVD